MAFRGQYDHSLDAKNRLNLPARFRPAFAGGVVLAKGLDTCVDVWTPDDFEAYTQSFLADLNPVSGERRKLTRWVAANAFDLEMDSAGRVTLNASLLGHAGIDKDVVVSGAIDHLEIWDRARWHQVQDGLRAEVPDIAENLGGPDR